MTQPSASNFETGLGELELRVDLAVIVPAYNEQGGVRSTVSRIFDVLRSSDWSFEVVVVDDGSTDETSAEAEAAGARVVRMPANRGYGAALKAGIAASNSEFVAIIDADGTYPEEALLTLMRTVQGADMAVGARSANSSAIPWVRKPGKRILTRLATFLAGQAIPDLNSGLRIMRRSALIRFIPILPSGFSFTTTITLAMMCSDLRVAYDPIEYRQRIGSSKISFKHFFSFLVLVLRTIVLFNPLKVFLPVGCILFVAGAAKFINDIFYWDLSESAVMALLAAVMVWCVGLLADSVSRLHIRS